MDVKFVLHSTAKDAQANAADSTFVESKDAMGITLRESMIVTKMPPKGGNKNE